MKATFAFPLLALLVLPAAASAQGHGAHGAPAATAAPGASTAAFREANARMHKDMDIRYSGDADADFVRAMIPHHQGAIAMAQVALRHAKDDETRRWAEAIVREQEREIAEMQAWLKKRGL